MRRAKQADYWRAIERNQGWKVRIERVAFSNIQSVGAGEITFKSPLNFLCGPNGVGKTTILRAIGAGLSPNEAKDSASTRYRLGGGKVTSTVKIGGNLHTVETDFARLSEAIGLSGEVDVYHVDTSSVVSDLQSYFCGFPQIQDALNGVPVLEASAEQIEVLSYLTKIPYKAARVYTLEETVLDSSGEEDNVIERPFFEVQMANSQYDSRSMGLGELAAHYLWWSLERVSDETILLIEEPESFLSPLCQTAFAGVLVKYTATKRPFVVVTTHSAQIIQSAPESSLLFIYKDGPNSKVSESPIEVLLKTVGIESKVGTLVLVEDNAARTFGKLWVSEFAPRDVATIEFIAMGGDGNIARALDAFPSNPKSLALIGLLDGDAEAKGFAGNRIAFLPGGKPVEGLYRQMLETEIDRVEPLLGINNIRAILFALAGSELHEWVEGLKLHSNLSSDQLHLVLFRAWISKQENRELAERYFSALSSKIKN